MDRKKVIKIFGGFLAVMLIFTILSRAVSGASMARVETVKISTGPIEHRVSASGKVEAGKEVAVYTQSGQRVKEICVQEGETVEKGEVLFRIDMEELEEQILAARQELEKTKLQNQDVQNAKAFEQNNQKTARQRAQEDYNQAVSQGDASVAETKRAWEEAEQALQDFINSPAYTGTGEQSAADSGQGKPDGQQADNSGQNGQSAAGSDQGEDGQSNADNSQGKDGQSEGGSQGEDGQSPEGNSQGEDGQSSESGGQGNTGESAADREAKRASLEQAAAEAKAAYEAAFSSRADSVRTAARALEDAARPQSAADSTEKQNEITRQQQELALNKLLSLQEAQGEIKATVSGLVTQILVNTGDFTSEGASVRLSDISQGGRLTMSVDKSNEEYVTKGSPVQIKIPGTKEVITDYTVSGVTENEEDKTLLDVTVDLPKGVVDAGTFLEVEITPKSETYATIVPLQALHEEQNGCYVLILQEEPGVLGLELVAKRLDVQVIDKNDINAALEEGLLTSDQEIIESSSRNIQEGSRVRRKDG